MNRNFLEEFPAISTTEWREALTKDLKGADYDRRLVQTNLDKITIQPFHRAEDLPAKASSPLKSDPGWTLREEIRDPDIQEANLHIHRALDRGAQSISVLTYPIGPRPVRQEEMHALLNGVWERNPVLHWQCGPLSVPMLAMLISEARVHDFPLSELRGSVDLDPILDRCAGWVVAPIDSWQAEATLRINEIHQALPQFGLLTLRGSFLEKAGCSIAQELAYVLAILQEYLVAALIRSRSEGSGFDLSLHELVQKTEIRLGIGTSYIFEIAKLRAVRLLVKELLKAHGITDVMPTIHATSTSSNKTVYDAYNNLLRGTIEAMAMTVGGADSITVAAYDQGYNTPDEFSEHLARNTHTLLAAEAHLDEVADPLAGSYTIEWLTQAYAEKAWILLREIEAEGGFVNAWKSGKIARDIQTSRESRSDQVRKRKRIIVGTTAFGNPNEMRLQDIAEKTPVMQVLPVADSLSDTIDRFIEAGAIEPWLTDSPVPSTGLDPYRVSWPYEHLRLRTERNTAKGGKRPVVTLALFGDSKMRNARSAFIQNVLAAAGYSYHERICHDPADLLDGEADLIILCSSDDQYLAWAKAAKAAVPLMVAGYPESDIQALEQAGITGFIHVKQPLDQTLENLHHFFEIPEFGPQSEAIKA